MLAVSIIWSVVFCAVALGKWTWLVGDDRPNPDSSGKDGIALANTQLAFILLYLVGLAKFLAPDKQFDYRFFFVHAVIGTALVGLSVGMLRSTTLDKRKRFQRTFSQGTIMFSKWVLGWTVALVAIIPVIAVLGWLPLHKSARQDFAKAIHVHDASRYVFKDDVVGIKVVAELSPEGDFKTGIPEYLLVVVRSSKKLHNDWDINEVAYYATTGDDRTPKDGAFAAEGSEEFEKALKLVPLWLIELDNLSPKVKYKIEFYLRPKSKKADLQKTIGELNEARDREFTITAIPRQG
jgi:hypothetical protein